MNVRVLYYELKRLWTYIRRYGVGGTLSFYKQLRFASRKKSSDVVLTPCRGPGTDRLSIRSCIEDVKAFEKFFLWGNGRLDNLHNVRSVLDLGANIGMASAFFRMKFPSAKIMAIEPDGANFQICTNNLRHLDISCLQNAVWTEECFVSCENPASRKDSLQFEPIKLPNSSAAANLISTVTIPNLIEQHFNGWIDLLKIDIEGAERELFFRATTDWLDFVGNVIVEFHDEESLLKGMKLLSNRGFSVTQNGEDVLATRDLAKYFA